MGFYLRIICLVIELFKMILLRVQVVVGKMNQLIIFFFYCEFFEKIWSQVLNWLHMLFNLAIFSHALKDLFLFIFDLDGLCLDYLNGK
jgi:hypothetical protein